MTAPSENKRLVLAFLAGWMLATCFSALAARGIPDVDAIIASAVMMMLFVLSGFAYSRLTWGKIAESADQTMSKTLDVRQVVLSSQQRCEEFAREHGLTPRQSEVCALLVEGKMVNDIADELYISKDTVKAHIKALYAKTGAHSKHELIAAVYAYGVPDLPESEPGGASEASAATCGMRASSSRKSTLFMADGKETRHRRADAVGTWRARAS